MENINRALAEIGDEVFRHWATTDVTAAALVEDVPRRIGTPLHSDSEASAVKARGWSDRLVSIDLNDLTPAEELSRRYLKFEIAKMTDAGQLHDFDFQITPYRIGLVLGDAHQCMQGLRLGDAQGLDRFDRLLAQYDEFLANTECNLRAQAAKGLVVPASALPGCLAAIQGLAEANETALTVAPTRLSKIAPPARAAFLERIEQSKARVRQRFAELLAYMKHDYARHAPQSLGLSQYPGGGDAYATLIRHHTSLDATSDEVHRQGIEWVQEIEADMAAIRSQLGFVGSAREFHDQLKRDPRFYRQTPAEVGEFFLAVMRRCEAALPRAFGARTFAPYAVRRLPADAEGGMTFGYYQPPLGSEPGCYLYNGSNLDERSLIGAASLILHELVPGHHLHVSTEMGDITRPLYRRLPTITIFSEGWAEYAADLGVELGLYEDPYDRYGRYLLQVFLACRLVVDTGLNARGWTRQQACEYLRNHTLQSQTEIDSEVLRYGSGLPGQALAYAPGRKYLWSLRKEAERRLGSRFQVSHFHDAVLDGGSLPLTDLKFSIEQWSTDEEKKTDQPSRNLPK